MLHPPKCISRMRLRPGLGSATSCIFVPGMRYQRPGVMLETKDGHETNRYAPTDTGLGLGLEDHLRRNL